jgi:transcriptional regulator with XRE-family HTH domain
MKQPELGKKISELRTSRGLTQEELVAKCNISVRTIQRIEAGEVMPRSYTVKTILAALDYDLAGIESENEMTTTPSNWFRDLMLIDIDLNKTSGFLIQQLNIAWIAGIVYFILGFFEGAAEYSRFMEDEMVFSNPVYLTIKIIAIISFAFFQRGFILIGGLFDNYLLKIVSAILIGVNTLVEGYDMFSIFDDSPERFYIMSGASLSFGVIGVIYGVSLRRLEKPLGRVAELAGIFEIVAALFFVTIFLAFFGFIALVPAEVLEIIMIFKTIEIIKSKQTEGALAAGGLA